MNKQNDTMGSITQLTSSFSIPVNLSVSKADIKKLEDLLKQFKDISEKINKVVGDLNISTQVMNEKE